MAKNLKFLGFSRYTVDKKAKVLNTKTGKYMSTHKNNAGYVVVSLTHDTDGKVNRLLHVLVAKAFISNPNDLPDVDHINEDKENCKSSNLQWMKHGENVKKSHPKRKKSKLDVGTCPKAKSSTS